MMVQYIHVYYVERTQTAAQSSDPVWVAIVIAKIALMIVYVYCVIASVPLDSRYDSSFEVDNRSRVLRDITHTQITTHSNTNKNTYSTPLGHMADSTQVAYPRQYRDGARM
jgi:hypothetical protein